MPERLSLDWMTRIKAWWEGYDLSKMPGRKGGRRGGAGGQSVAAEDNTLAVSAIWSVQRIAVVESVWGDGFHTPSGEEHIPTLIKPLGLDETKSVLDLGAGLGGVTRQMARATNAWVTGLEGDEVLAREGMARSVRAGLEKRAPVMRFDPENVVFDKRHDVIFAKEAFFTIRKKNELFDAILAGIKPRGQLLFTDYVLKHSAGTGHAITAWRDNELVKPHPWTVSQVVDRLKVRKFDIRITEDITDLHRHLILAGWDRLTGMLPGRWTDPDIRRLVVEEAEMWMRRMSAFETGDLRVYRFFALAPSGEF